MRSKIPRLLKEIIYGIIGWKVKKLKKILLVVANITTRNMKIYLQQIGYEVIEWRAPSEGDINHRAAALFDVLDDSYYAVFTYDFFPQFAQICYEKSIYYISWVVDNPHFPLWSNEVKYPINRIFVFDKSQCEQLEKRNVDNVFYLPLGADIDYFDKIDYSQNKFRADVAFVGSLYDEPAKNLFLQIPYLPPYAKAYIEALIQTQLKRVDNIIIKEMIPTNVWEEIKKCVNLLQDNSYDFAYEECFVSMLQMEATRRERCQAVTLLNEFFDLKLYTGSSVDFDPKLKKQKYVDYETEMPLVFRQSKININITLRSIISGIPLRALDVMASGGFLLSNFQKELAEYFEEDRECVFFYNLEDMVAKADYYLKHEEERKRIAAEGYKKVKNEFSLKGQLEKMKILLERHE